MFIHLLAIIDADHILMSLELINGLNSNKTVD